MNSISSLLKFFTKYTLLNPGASVQAGSSLSWCGAFLLDRAAEAPRAHNRRGSVAAKKGGLSLGAGAGAVIGPASPSTREVGKAAPPRGLCVYGATRKRSERKRMASAELPARLENKNGARMVGKRAASTDLPVTTILRPAGPRQGAEVGALRALKIGTQWAAHGEPPSVGNILRSKVRKKGGRAHKSGPKETAWRERVKHVFRGSGRALVG
ncbi:hypothetical protein NDU88_004488 [Pleurodeles waltl]|uniref:Uncharacterized protein n=1 Tax=Pleurodeles waltl TaxID=8319 RepID=A0AAV7WSG5_PLEWA|nr:hypothetical protein NDU88_004488 [Pleurodeles waltl]